MPSAQYAIVKLVSRLPARVQVALSGEPPVVIDGQRLDPMAQWLRGVRRRRGFRGILHPSIEAARRRYRRETREFRGPVTPVRQVRELALEGGGVALRMRHYAPNAESTDLLVYFHGGGFVIGDLDTHDEPCRLLCHLARTHVVSVDYRLAPEHPFPAAVDDAEAALRWAHAHAAELGVDPSRIAVAGDSAGANLAAVVALTSPPAHASAQLLIYPATDTRTARPSQTLFDEGFLLTRADREAFFRHYVPNGGDDPRLSPLRASDLSPAPRALVATAGFDILRDEGGAYAEALRMAGVRVRRVDCLSLEHGFIHLTGICRTAREAVERIARDWRSLIDER